MKIANVFGLYIGCKVKLKGGYISTLHGVYKMNGMFKLNKRSTFNEPLKDCKLLLTPLSKITEEDKREFEKEFGYSPGVLGFVYRDDDLWNLAGNGEIFVKSTESEKFWLRSKGYDIPDGLVPDEYKEIVE